VKEIKRWKLCLKDQLEDPNYVGKCFREYEKHESTQLEECSTEQR
jgi:hypothetical protein